MKKYPRLALMFTALLVVVCRCGTGYNPLVTLSNGNTMACKQYRDISGSLVYACAVPCPDGSFVNADFDQPGLEVTYIPSNLEELQERYCADMGNPVSAGETATPSPTSTPTATSAP